MPNDDQSKVSSLDHIWNKRFLAAKHISTAGGIFGAVIGAIIVALGGIYVAYTNQRWSTDQEALKAKISQLERQIASRGQGESEQVVAMDRKLHESEEQRETQVGDLKRQLADVQTDLAGLQKKSQDAQNQVETLKQQLSDTKFELAEVQGKLADAQARLESKNRSA